MTDFLNEVPLTGDRSGRPDVSGVDHALADDYAQRMFWAVVTVNFKTCKRLHDELNKDWALYQFSLDLFKAMCRQRGMNSGRWREYSSD